MITVVTIDFLDLGWTMVIGPKIQETLTISGMQYLAAQLRCVIFFFFFFLLLLLLFYLLNCISSLIKSFAISFVILTSDNELHFLIILI